MFIKKIDKHIQENPTREKKQFYCEVCDLQMFTAAYFKTHLKGRRHRENSGESDGAKESWEGFFQRKKIIKEKTLHRFLKVRKEKRWISLVRSQQPSESGWRILLPKNQFRRFDLLSRPNPIPILLMVWLISRTVYIRSGMSSDI